MKLVHKLNVWQEFVKHLCLSNLPVRHEDISKLIAPLPHIILLFQILHRSLQHVGQPSAILGPVVGDVGDGAKEVVDHTQVYIGIPGRVSLKRQNILLRPGHLNPTVFRYEKPKKPFTTFRLHI